ncbi:MAG: hypothetical protein COT34_01700 [Candidatus Nealsonbacteria bacterium CG08_land_8_20_14_0_20_43_11]|uniref:PIN domain-containing protein n=1 Tax=Candidatus Nealsonbacteria bacterium CG08_land_8_20_14_0_20_43_11 TaxID=1974706 RepID=A0A2M6T0H0_9BACT|nr:MAG: hypothetical protein COT34_01700 [Candidatus Nealsonbacteria bacterium CG08_land_8_20_14_0_20_43_11]
MKEFNYFIDSNVFLRPIVKDDQKKLSDCEKFFKQIEKFGPISFISDAVLAEIAWVLRSFYKLERETIAGSLVRIINIKNIRILNGFKAREAIDLYQKHSIKFVDALIASHPKIQSKKMVVISYDKDFDKLGVKRQTPGEVLAEKK